MKAKEIAILAGAALAAYLLLRSLGGSNGGAGFWAVAQGNTGYPAEAYTGIPAAGGGGWGGSGQR